MATISKKDLIDKVSEKVDDKDTQMELLEDITDSFDMKDEVISKKDYDSLKTDYDIMTKKYNDLQDKYISRFSAVETNPRRADEKLEEVEEKKVIDVRSIF